MARSSGDLRRPLWIIWGAMVASIVIYAGVALAFAPRGPASDSLPGLELWLGIEAAATFWATIVIRKTRLTDPILSGALDPDSAAGKAAIRKISIVCWALAESIAIFGLIVAFTRRSAQPALMFIGGALLLELLLAPRLK